jgi:hypothetical protein
VKSDKISDFRIRELVGFCQPNWWIILGILADLNSAAMSDVNQTNAKLWRAERQEVASPFLSDAHRTEQLMLTHSFGGFLIF